MLILKFSCSMQCMDINQSVRYKFTPSYSKVFTCFGIFRVFGMKCKPTALMIFSFLGVNKYFQMACIYEKFRNSVNKDITSKVIWDHLDTMYDMQALVRLRDEFIIERVFPGFG